MRNALHFAAKVRRPGSSGRTYSLIDDRLADRTEHSCEDRGEILVLLLHFKAVLRKYMLLTPIVFKTAS
jgi:hypothetical protein